MHTLRAGVGLWGREEREILEGEKKKGGGGGGGRRRKRGEGVNGREGRMGGNEELKGE